MSQTAVETAPAIGVPGQLSNTPGEVVARTSAEASASIPFGIVVKPGTADRTVKILTATSNSLEGITVFAQGYHRVTELDADGLRPGCTFDVVREGRVLVLVEDAVTPASEVHVRAVGGGSNGYGDAGAETVGALRGTADGTDTIDISGFARYVSSAGAGEIAELEVDFTNASLAVADT